jgi:hypothetical protein
MANGKDERRHRKRKRAKPEIITEWSARDAAGRSVRRELPVDAHGAGLPIAHIGRVVVHHGKLSANDDRGESERNR